MKESVKGIDTKEPMTYELLDKLENEKYKLERFKGLDPNMAEEGSE